MSRKFTSLSFTVLLSLLLAGCSTEKITGQSSLAGQTLGGFGDSIFTAATVMQYTANENLMTLNFSDGVIGRSTADMLSNFNLPSAPGTGESDIPLQFAPKGATDLTPGEANGVIAGLPAGTKLGDALGKLSVLVIGAGGNDLRPGGQEAYGSPSDAPAYRGTYLAQVRWLLETIYSYAPDIRIVWVSPFNQPCRGRSSCTPNVTNNSYGYPTGLADALKSVLGDYGILLVDGRNMGFNQYNASKYLAQDLVHETDLGAKKLYAPYLAQKIREILAGQ